MFDYISLVHTLRLHRRILEQMVESPRCREAATDCARAADVIELLMDEIDAMQSAAASAGAGVPDGPQIPGSPETGAGAPRAAEGFCATPPGGYIYTVELADPTKPEPTLTMEQLADAIAAPAALAGHRVSELNENTSERKRYDSD